MLTRRDELLAYTASLLGTSLEQLLKTPIGTMMLGRDRPFAQQFAKLLQRIIANTGSIEFAEEWLDLPHVDLDGRAPLAVIQAGHISVIEDLMEAYETGQPS